jgi:MtN3 and saliva related transmembrane protein
MGAHASSSFIESIGFVAGILTTLAFVPQVIKTWRSRSAGDLSATTLTILTIGIMLWVVYGTAVASRPLVISNAVTLGLTAMLLVLKLRYARQVLIEGRRVPLSQGVAPERVDVDRS